MVLSRGGLIDELFYNSETSESCALAYLPTRGDKGTVGLAPSINSAFNRGLKIANHHKDCMSLVGYDFRVGEVYVAGQIISPRSGAHFHTLIKEGILKKVEHSNGRILLEPDAEGRRVYYITSLESVRVPRELSLIVDAKSTTGRVATMCVDQSRTFRERSLERTCPIVTTTQPYKFPLIITPGKTKLAQGIFRHTFSDPMSTEQVIEDQPNISLTRQGRRITLKRNGRVTQHGVAMRFNTSLVLKAKNRVPDPIDMDAREVYDIPDYFEIIEGNDSFTLDPREFYLMGTLEDISLGDVCGVLSRETPETGTGLWGHFAGIIQPFWTGQITMECRTEVKRTIPKGYDAGYIKFEKITGLSEEDRKPEGSYQGQKAPRAPKMFKPLE